MKASSDPLFPGALASTSETCALTVVPSPCRRECRLDAQGILCLSCGRTLDEIARWGSMSDVERRAVRRRLMLDEPT